MRRKGVLNRLSEPSGKHPLGFFLFVFKGSFKNPPFAPAWRGFWFFMRVPTFCYRTKVVQYSRYRHIIADTIVKIY